MSAHCSNCNNPLTCTPSSNCWCKEFPPILSPNSASSCLCRNCLIDASAKVINVSAHRLSSEEKQSIAALGLPEQPKLDTDYYMENGLLVMTKWYLLRRAYCCNNDCRHCPYKEKQQ